MELTGTAAELLRLATLVDPRLTERARLASALEAVDLAAWLRPIVSDFDDVRERLSQARTPADPVSIAGLLAVAENIATAHGRAEFVGALALSLALTGRSPEEPSAQAVGRAYGWFHLDEFSQLRASIMA